MLIQVRRGLPPSIRAVTGSLREVHAGRAERWFGPDTYQKLLRVNHPWPIAVGGARAPVYAYRHSLLGPTRVGEFASFADALVHKGLRSQHGGFASLSDLIAEASGGKLQMLAFTKAGTTGVVGVMNSLARVGPMPLGQTTAAAFAAGESPTNTTPAGLGLGNVNATGGDTLHVTGAHGIVASVASQLLLLYDRFYQGNHNIATDPQAVSGTPARYQSVAARGNFISCEVSTALGAGTPTYEVTYVDQDGNTAEATTSLLTIAASAIVNRFPFATPDWQFRLNAGDTGVRALTNLNLSAASTGNLNVFLGKPLVLVPMPPVANMPVSMDLVRELVSLPQILDNACLCLLELFKSATGATNWTGYFSAVSG